MEMVLHDFIDSHQVLEHIKAAHRRREKYLIHIISFHFLTLAFLPTEILSVFLRRIHCSFYQSVAQSQVPD